MTTAAPTRRNGHDPTRDVLVEAARRMLPILAGRVLAAATDRAVDGVDQLADRLGGIAERGFGTRDDPDDRGEGRSGGGVSAVVAEGVRRFLELVARLLAQAAMMLRTATDRLRRRRAPEGIDDAEDDADGADEDAAIGA